MLMRELNLALDEQILLKLLYFTNITMESLQRGAIFAFDDEKYVRILSDLSKFSLTQFLLRSEDGDNIIKQIANMPLQTNWVFSSFMFINPMKFNVTFLGYRPDDSVRYGVAENEIFFIWKLTSFPPADLHLQMCCWASQKN